MAGKWVAAKDTIGKQAVAIQGKIAALEQKLAALRAKAPKPAVADYALTAPDGRKTKLSALFGKHDHLVLVHNMGSSCNLCTMWADGFNAIYPHVEKRAAFALASADPAPMLKRHAKKRGWRFRAVSAAGTNLFDDMGHQTADGGPMPGVTVFHRGKNGAIERGAVARFGPGDKFCSVFSFLALLPANARG
jgi:predicted dithiol-disulfide oxidoreductase (DUF899 family)